MRLGDSSSTSSPSRRLAKKYGLLGRAPRIKIGSVGSPLWGCSIIFDRMAWTGGEVQALQGGASGNRPSNSVWCFFFPPSSGGEDYPATAQSDVVPCLKALRNASIILPILKLGVRKKEQRLRDGGAG